MLKRRKYSTFALVENLAFLMHFMYTIQRIIIAIIADASRAALCGIDGRKPILNIT